MEIPHIIKYMGSKRNILDFVYDSINEIIVDDNQRLYDLFGGSAIISAAFREKLPVTCNDIQSYTGILAATYLKNYYWDIYEDDILSQIVKQAQNQVDLFINLNPNISFDYNQEITFSELKMLESQQQKLINHHFIGKDHLFVKNFSGTYWSFEQCLWIDALSSVARSDSYRNSFLYNVIISSLMFAMAYCTQSTGHYAQYRDVTETNMNDILFYRRKNIISLFMQKFESLKDFYNGDNNTNLNHQIFSEDFSVLLNNIEDNSIVYADPPYQFVHYSRFYHALETLTKYDYPVVTHKGRYRTDRHQSPFCIKTKVKGAFTEMFEKIFYANSSLVLSYSDNGMITKEELIELAHSIFQNYRIEVKDRSHIHSTMGRQGDKSRMVREVLIICTCN